MKKHWIMSAFKLERLQYIEMKGLTGDKVFGSSSKLGQDFIENYGCVSGWVWIFLVWIYGYGTDMDIRFTDAGKSLLGYFQT